MSTVQEIQEAIAKLPEEQLFELTQWLHEQNDWDVAKDPLVAASVERGERQLDIGASKPLDEVRQLSSTWITK